MKGVREFVVLDVSRPEVVSLMSAMLQARTAVERRSWLHPHEPTDEEWWADVLADPRAQRQSRSGCATCELSRPSIGCGTSRTRPFWWPAASATGRPPSTVMPSLRRMARTIC
jgi:hypothetical protein